LKLEAEPLKNPYLLGALFNGVCQGFIVLRTRMGLLVSFRFKIGIRIRDLIFFLWNK
jgi:hypothetical protein